MRLAHILMALLRALDIVLCVVWLSPLYLVGLADRPTGNETISAYIGGGLLNRRPWARLPAHIIDTIAYALTGQYDHCRNAALYYRKLLA